MSNNEKELIKALRTLPAPKREELVALIVRQYNKEHPPKGSP